MFNVKELWEYCSAVRRGFINKLVELPWEEVTKNREASFYSMRNIIIHMLDNEYWMVNYVVQGRSTEYNRESADSYSNMKMILERLNEVESKTKEFLDEANEVDFKKKVTLVAHSGESFELEVEECLLQSFTEQLYHMGELIALMWQENIEPPKMAWFRNNPRQKKSMK